MGLCWESIPYPWVILMKKIPPLAPCVGGKTCHQGNAFIDSWKPNVLFMATHLYLLKEEDWSRFVALSLVAGSVQQRCVHPLRLKQPESRATKGIIATQVVWLCHTPNLLRELARLGLYALVCILQISRWCKNWSLLKSECILIIRRRISKAGFVGRSNTFY